MYVVYVREGYYFSLVCRVNKAIENFELKVDVQKGALRFRRKIDNGFASFIQLPYFIQMSCVLGSAYYELYPMNKNNVQ